MRARPAPSHVVSPTDAGPQRLRADVPGRFTPAELRAMERSAPLTPEQFKQLRRRAERGVSPLRRS